MSMQHVWHKLVRQYRLLSPRERLGCLLVVLLGLGAIGWTAWAQFALPDPQHISMTTLVDDARKGLIQSANITGNSIDVAYRDGKAADFRGQLPDESLVLLVRSGVDVSF